MRLNDYSNSTGSALVGRQQSNSSNLPAEEQARWCWPAYSRELLLCCLINWRREVALQTVAPYTSAVALPAAACCCLLLLLLLLLLVMERWKRTSPSQWSFESQAMGSIEIMRMCLGTHSYLDSSRTRVLHFLNLLVLQAIAWHHASVAARHAYTRKALCSMPTANIQIWHVSCHRVHTSSRLSLKSHMST